MKRKRKKACVLSALFADKCSRRCLETEMIIDYLKLNNYSLTKNISEADLIYISSCAFSNETENASILSIIKILRTRKTKSKVVVGGCLPKINNKRLQKLGNFKTISPRTIDKLDKIINCKIKFRNVDEANILQEDKSSIKFSDLLRLYVDKCDFTTILRGLMSHFAYSFNDFFNYRKKHFLDSQLYSIKISEGCLGDCSYCCIKFAIGKLKSKPIKRIIEEFETGLRHGYKNFKLSSEDAGCYGIDINTNIAELLRKIFDHEGDYTIILHNISPNALIKYFDSLLDIVKKNHKKIKYVHIPIQSGSDKILKIMRRPYKIRQVEKCLLDLKKSVNGVKFTTHMIVGFPGESKEEFEKTLELIKKVKFHGIGIFTYSDRAGTEATKMKNKIPERIKLWRKLKLMYHYKLTRTLS